MLVGQLEVGGLMSGLDHGSILVFAPGYRSIAKNA
jgi:hypothetical protein